MAKSYRKTSAAGTTRSPHSRFRRDFSRLNAHEIGTLTRSKAFQYHNADLERCFRRAGRSGVPATQTDEALVVQALYYVKKVAAQYAGRGLPYLDLVQEGSIGLLKALKRYDPKKGKFLTYADWWIRQSISDALLKCGTIVRTPVNYKVGQLMRFMKRFAEIHNREPLPHEMAKELDITLSAAVLHMERRHFSDDNSLQAAVGNDVDDRRTRSEHMSDTSEVSPDTRVIAEFELRAAQKSVRRVFDGKVWGKLSLRNRRIVLLRYGLDSVGRCCTNAEISRECALTPEAVRQILQRFWRYNAKARGSSPEEKEKWFEEELERITEIAEYLQVPAWEPSMKPRADI